jgi:hypothetical protein
LKPPFGKLAIWFEIISKNYLKSPF